MSKLLNAGFARLLRNKVLWACMIILGVTNGIFPIFRVLLNVQGNIPDTDLLSGMIQISIMTAVLTASFLGAEHHFGTIRNKLIIGHGRAEVYVSSFLVCFTGMLVMFALVWLLTLVLGNLLMGGFVKSSHDLLVLFLRSFLAMTALTALYTAVGLCVQSKSISSVAAVICAFVMIIASVAIIQSLMEPEYYPADSVIMTDEEFFETAPDDPSLVINPYYISGTKRKIYQCIYDFCPISQILDETGDLGAKTVCIPLAEIAVLIAAGFCIFKKRDLK